MFRRQWSSSSNILHVAGLHWTGPGGERVSDIQLDFSIEAGLAGIMAYGVHCEPLSFLGTSSTDLRGSLRSAVRRETVG